MVFRIPRWKRSRDSSRRRRSNRLSLRTSRVEALEERAMLSINGSPNLDFTIEGVNFDESGLTPPDPIGAVGPSHLVSAVNSNLEIHTKTGTLQFSEDLTTFFAPLAPGSTPFDPKVIYDQHAGRFVVLALEQTDTGMQLSPTNVSRILLAVSDDDNPNGTWHFQAINSRTFLSGPLGLEDAWVDFPALSIDEEALYITGIMFPFLGGVTDSRARLWIVPKGEGSSGIYDGGTSAERPYDPGFLVGMPELVQMAPAHMFGAAPAGVGVFLASYTASIVGDNETLNIIRVNNPLDAVPSFNLQQIPLGDIDSQATLPDAPQLGTGAEIETENQDVLQMVWRDNTLWATNTITPPSGADAGQATAHWYQIDTTNLAALALADQGDVGGEDIAPGTHTFFPSIMVDAAGNMAIGFAASGPFIFPGAYFTGRRADDVPGTTRGSAALAEGEDFYLRTLGGARNRWGDYTGLALDPTDETTLWVFNEYALRRDPVPDTFGHDGRWGTRWGRFDLDITPEVGINFSIDDVTRFEGDSGTTAFDFTVTLSEDPTGTATVGFITSNGSATTVSGDYLGQLGTLTFSPGGPLSQTVSVLVNGDTASEFDETFFVSLSNPVGAVITKGLGTGTIVNDDGGITGIGTPTLDITFDAITIDESGFVPPDPIGAVGPNHVVNVVNANIEWFTKDGVQQQSQALFDFFAPLNPLIPDPNAGMTLTDPKVIYDQYSERFVVTFLEIFDNGTVLDALNTSRIFLAVSDDSDPNGSWSFQAINSKGFESTFGGLTDVWADYPGFAVGEDAIYVTANMFPFADGVLDSFISRLWIIDKGEGTGGLYDGGISSAVAYDPGEEVGRSFLFTLQPAETYGNLPSGVGTFLVSYTPVTGGPNPILNVIRVDDPLGTPSFTLHELPLGNIDSGLPMIDAPQPNANVPIDTGDRRILEAVWRDNALWATNTVVPGSGPDAAEATAHWYKVNTSNLASLFLADQGSVGGEGIAPDTHTFFPSIAVDAAGNMAMGFAASGPNIFPGAYYTGRSAGDPSGTTLPPGVLAEGIDSYIAVDNIGRNRWGDYTGIAIDPVNAGTFWVYNEYALLRAADGSGRWGTRWGSFTFSTPPPTGAALSISDVTQLEGDAGTTAFQFIVSLSAAVAGTVTVSFATVAGSATENIDYQPTSGSLTFNPGGSLSQTVTVLVNGDIALEPDETVFVNLINPVGAGLADPQGVGTILNDDDTSTLSNSPPVAVDDMVTTFAGIPVVIDILDNDSDPDVLDGDMIVPATVEIGITPIAGTLSIDPATGEVTYTPNDAFGGPDSFSYTVRDTFGAESNQAVVSIQVKSGPTAVDDEATTAVNTPVDINVLANDNDLDGTVDPSTLMVMSGPANGMTMISPSGIITYTPNAGFAGGDQFTYRVRDNEALLSNEATVRIRVGSAVSLAGEIYADINNNGVRDVGELGIENVLVTISKIDGPLTFSHILVTDADGQYSIAEGAGNDFVLPAGIYAITETQPVAFHDGIDTPGTPAPVGPPTNDQFLGIVLGDGQSATGFRFGERGLRGEFIDDFLGGNMFFAAAAVPALGLGAELPQNISLLDGNFWFTFDAGWEGTLDMMAQFQSISGGAALTLYDNDLNVLSTSALETNQAQIEWQGTAGAPYVLQLSGTNIDVDIQLSQVMPATTNSAPVFSPIGPFAVDEGTTLTFNVDATDLDNDTLTYVLQPGAPEGASLDPETGAFSWTPADSSDEDIYIPILVLDGAEAELGDLVLVQVTVANVAPNVAISGPTDGQSGVPIALVLSAVDPSADDQAADFTFDIDWDGDGAFDETIVGPSGMQVGHAYSDAASYSIQVRATDKDGGTGAPATHAVTIVSTPGILDVQVGGSSWSADFQSALRAVSQGPTDPSSSGISMSTLPWVNIDLIQVMFDGPVEVAAEDLSIFGVNVAQYTLLPDSEGGFTYDASTFTATWRLVDPIGSDRLAVVVSNAASPYYLDVVPGDITGNGVVDIGDYTTWANYFGTTSGVLGTRADLNADGVVDLGDYTSWSNHFASELPTGEPLSSQTQSVSSASLTASDSLSSQTPSVSGASLAASDPLDEPVLDALGAHALQAATVSFQLAARSGGREPEAAGTRGASEIAQPNPSVIARKSGATAAASYGGANRWAGRGRSLMDQLHSVRGQSEATDSVLSRENLNWLLHSIFEIFESDDDGEEN